MFLIAVQRDVETPGVSSICASHLEKLVIGHILRSPGLSFFPGPALTMVVRSHCLRQF